MLYSHISEIDHKRVEKVEDYIKQGEVLDVKVIGKDPKNGKLKISRKALLKNQLLRVKRTVFFKGPTQCGFLFIVNNGK